MHEEKQVVFYISKCDVMKRTEAGKGSGDMLWGTI